MWLCVTPERVEKTQRIMAALSEGWPGSRICVGRPPNDGAAFMVWGRKWLGASIIPSALQNDRPFWLIDNGFTNPARGERVGNYRFMYRSPSPVLFIDEVLRKKRGVKVEMKPWRKSGDHVLIALPGKGFGLPFGIDMDAWCKDILHKVLKHTKRPIRIRERTAPYPIENDFRNAWAVVTHSSNVSVDAVRAGLPVFVEPTSMAAPVGNLDLADLETPKTPDRCAWWESLSCQQFSIDEMRDGVAYQYLSAVARQVDEKKAAA